MGWLSSKGKRQFLGCPIMGPLLHSCVEVREPIELSFGMASVTPGIHVLDGGPHASREGVDFGPLAQ